ncbi:MAG: 50S ribosomal protein L28 [Ignavibacteriales bacterium]|nr:50S ribosomal protein L28 [Ignavibacteriales bacterium]
MCGKAPVSGNNISHAHNRTRRRWLPNLQHVRAKVDGEVETDDRLHTVHQDRPCREGRLNRT